MTRSGWRTLLAPIVTKHRQVLLLLGALALLASPFLLYYPVHDILGLCNTRYSARFSDSAFARISVGMPRDQVIALLGDPLQATQHKDYPVWALREERVRNRYDRDSHIDREVLSFSAPRRSHWDYELIHVSLGPDSTVIDTSQFVTD